MIQRDQSVLIRQAPKVNCSRKVRQSINLSLLLVMSSTPCHQARTLVVGPSESFGTRQITRFRYSCRPIHVFMISGLLGLYLWQSGQTLRYQKLCDPIALVSPISTESCVKLPDTTVVQCDRQTSTIEYNSSDSSIQAPGLTSSVYESSYYESTLSTTSSIYESILLIPCQLLPNLAYNQQQ